MGATKAVMRDMANDLLAERGGKPVGKHCKDNCKMHTPEINLQKCYPYDHQRALQKDSRVITPWFQLVVNIKVRTH